MKKILVILGPTSTGKTDVGLYLAKKFSGEIIACDSRQIYKGLDLIAGKYPGEYKSVIKKDGFWLIDEIAVWLYDKVPLSYKYSTFNFVQDARLVLEDILSRGKLPIIVGGTGLYLKALLEGLPNLSTPTDEKLRKKLEKYPKKNLQGILRDLSLKRWKELNESDRKNPRRLIRAIELASVYRKSNESFNLIIKDEFNVLKIGLTAPISWLREKINQRIDKRLKEGMVKEAEKLKNSGLSFRMKELGLEASLLTDYLAGKATFGEMVEKMKVRVGQFAKRQITWFKKEKDVSWFDITSEFLPKVVEKVSIWYDKNQ